jgi:glycosyltransferase involved in cell wall biosynthesis
MSAADGRIKVVVIVTRFMAGAGGVALRGALALDPERYEISFVTGGGRLTDDARAFGFDVAVMPDMVANLSPRRDARAVRLLTELLVDRRPDVVHTHSAKAGGVGRIAAHRAGVPRIVHTYHGFPFHEFQRPWTKAAYVAAESYLCRRTDVVLTVGSAVAVEAIRRGIVHPGQLRTIAVAIDAEPVACTPKTRAHARELLGIAADVPVVGTVGRLDYQKAPQDFVRAIAALRHQNAVGVWVGDGSLRRDVERLIDRHGLRGRIMLVGDRTDVAVLLPAFDVFAMSSRYEGLPCAVVEAMAAGVPVVATAVNAVSDVVLPGETGLLVPPQQPGALASAIDLVLDDPVSAQLRVGRAKALLGNRFRPEQLGVVLDEVYVARPPGTPQLSRRVSAALTARHEGW